jgi:hypothetical protein
MVKFFERPKPAGTKSLPHDPRLSEIVTKIDYEMPAAISELVDNSVDAESKHILIRVIQNKEGLESLFVIDDGNGIRAEDFDEAMRYARQRSYGSGDTGMYGIGMKSSSLNMARTMSVISRTRGARLAGRTWSRETAKQAQIGIIAENECGRIYEDLDGSLPWNNWDAGTIVQWSEIDDFERAKGTPAQVNKFTQVQLLAVERHIGLFFHRIIERKTKPIKMFLDIQDADTREILDRREIEPINPFGYAKSGDPQYPKNLTVKLPNGKNLTARAHIWPKGMKSQNFKIPRGNHAGAAESQGIYIYRNDRLLMAGGWKNIRNSEAHQALARLEIHLGDDTNQDVGISYNKTGVNLPVAITQRLREARAKDGTTFDMWIDRAIAVNRTSLKKQQEIQLPTPTKGLPLAVQKIFEQESTKGDEVEIEWRRLPQGQVFRIVPSNDKILVNSDYRDAFNVGGGSGTRSTSLPLALLILATKDLIGKKKTEKFKALNSSLQRIMFAAIKEQS